MGILGSSLEEWYIALERRVARLERTASVANSQSDTSFVGTLAISGLAVSSQTVVAYSTDFNVYVKFSWNAVTLDSNIITTDPLLGYYTSFTKDGINYTNELFTDGTTATIGPLPQGQLITFRVRAVTQKNTYGAYSTINVTTTLDNTAPGQPSTPTVAPYLGQLRVFWDGKDVSTAAMPQDFRYCEIHLSTTGPTFTPTAATLVDTFLSGGGFTTLTDLTYGTTYYVRLVAVDQVGNRSPVSTAGSGVPVQATDGDIASLNVGKLVAGTLTADITVSARIKTANTGARVELNSSGLQAFNTAGTQTVDVQSSTGNVSILGNFKTGVAGGGSAYMTIDDSTDRTTMKFFNAAGTAFAFMNSPAGASVPQIGINTGTYLISGATTGYSRLFLRDGAGISLETVRASDQTQFGGSLALDSGGLDLKYTPLGGAASGGRVLINSTSVDIRKDVAGVTTGGKVRVDSGSAFFEYNSAGTGLHGLQAYSGGVITYGNFNSQPSWSAVDGANWTVTFFRLDKWGPFAVLTFQAQRTANALAAGNFADNTVCTISSTGGELPSDTGHLPAVQASNSNGVGAAAINPTTGVVSINNFTDPISVGHSVRFQSAWYVGV